MSATASEAGQAAMKNTNATMRVDSERTPLLAGSGSPAQNAAPPDTVPPPSLKSLAPAILSLWLALFFSALDGTVASTLVPSITSSFQSAEKASWMGTSFLLSLTVFSPLYGRLSDGFGRSNAMVVALTIFTLGTAACAFAPSMNALLAARALAGAGAGGIATCASIIMTDLVSLRLRGLFQGVTNIIFSSGVACGGLYGGIMDQRSGWRSAFSFQVPFLLAAMVLISINIRIPIAEEFKEMSLRRKLGRIDWLGSLLLALSLGGLLVCLSSLSAPPPKGQTTIEWTWPTVYGPGLVFILGIITFLLVEAFVVAEPVVPLRLLKQRTPGAVCAVFFITSCSYYPVAFYLPLWFQATRGYSPSQAGLRMAPNALFVSSGSLGAGLIMRHTGRYWRLQVITAFLPVLSVAHCLWWTPDWPYGWDEYLGLGPAFFGIACCGTTLLIALMAALPRKDIAVGNGLMYLARTSGQTIGVGIAGSILQAVLTNRLHARIEPLVPAGADESERIISSILHSVDYIGTLPPAIERAARWAYADAMRGMFVFATVFNFLAFLCCLPIEEKSIDLPGAAVAPSRPPEASASNEA